MTTTLELSGLSPYELGLSGSREAVENADQKLRAVRRERNEYDVTLTLLQQRLKALDLLVSIRSSRP